MMIRRALIVTTVVIFAGLGFAQSGSNSPIHLNERQQDVYAIYSLLMPGAVLANLGSSQNQSWAIADTTVNAEDINPALAPEAALKPPNDHPRRFHDAVVDYEQRRNARQPVIRGFHLDRPYTLLTSSDIQEFQDSRTSVAPDSAIQQKYSGYPGINYFSDVYFNPQRSAALVYMVAWCTNLCGQGEWVYLEKQSGQWVRRSGQASIVSGAKPF
jgi:hypothetical protein